MDKRFIGSVAIAALFASGAALAAEETGMQSFEDIDVDKSGYISQEEAASSPTLLDNWDTADANSDGAVDQAEFAAFEEQLTKPEEPAGAMEGGAGTTEGGGM